MSFQEEFLRYEYGRQVHAIFHNQEKPTLFNQASILNAYIRALTLVKNNTEEIVIRNRAVNTIAHLKYQLRNLPS